MGYSADAPDTTLTKALEEHYEAQRKCEFFPLYSHILSLRFSQRFTWILTEKSNSEFTVERQNHGGNPEYSIDTEENSCGTTSSQQTELSCAHVLLIAAYLAQYPMGPLLNNSFKNWLWKSAALN